MMNEMLHPQSENLEAFAAGSIEPGDRAVIESHLMACSECQSSVEEWRSLFSVLASLPALSPAPGFSDRVMARVRIAPATAMAWHARAVQQAAHWLPKTTRGWSMLVAILALPVVTGGSVLGWLITRSYITPTSLWIFAQQNAQSAAGRIGTMAVETAMETNMFAWLAANTAFVFDMVGVRGLGAVAALAALIISVSAWYLYKNLFRAPTRESSYVTYSF